MFQNLGHALALLRELRGLSQAECARRAGVGKSQLSKYEKGKELPKLESLGKVLVVLDVRQDGFFSVVAAVDRLAEGERWGPIAGTGSRSIDEAIESVMRKLLGLQRVVLEEFLSEAQMPGRRPPWSRIAHDAGGGADQAPQQLGQAGQVLGRERGRAARRRPAKQGDRPVTGSQKNG